MNDNIGPELEFDAMRAREDGEIEPSRVTVWEVLGVVALAVLVVVVAGWCGTEQGQAFLDYFDEVSK